MGRPQIYRTCKQDLLWTIQKIKHLDCSYMTPANCAISTIFPLSYLSSLSQVGNSSRHILFSQRPFNVFLFTSPIWEKDTHIRTKYVNSWITADSFLPLALQLLPSYTVHFFSTTYCSQWSWKVNLTALPYYHCITPSEVSSRKKIKHSPTHP